MLNICGRAHPFYLVTALYYFKPAKEELVARLLYVEHRRLLDGCYGLVGHLKTRMFDWI